MNWYKELLYDHYKNPKNRGYLDDHNFASTESNPSCGDKIQFTGKMCKEGFVSEINFQGEGCVISIATASLLTDAVKQKMIQEILSYDCQFITNLIGVSLGPVRLKCALLPLRALQQSLRLSKISDL